MGTSVRTGGAMLDCERPLPGLVERARARTGTRTFWGRDRPLAVARIAVGFFEARLEG